MGAALRRAAYWLVAVALFVIGVRNAPRQTGAAQQQPWHEVMPWLQDNWIVLGCLVLAAVLTTIPITQWFSDRHHAKALANKIRRNLTPGSFAETDAADALAYLLKESRWAWRQYTRLNFWGMVDGLHLREFKRAAASGDILTVGWSSAESKIVTIDRRYWRDGRIDEATAKAHGAVVMVIGHPSGHTTTFSQLAVATAELELVWPRASMLRRAWSRAWVWLKARWYGLTGRLEYIRWLGRRNS